MGVIATLLPNQKLLRRVQTALRGRHEVVTCADWEELVRVCGQQAVRLAFIDLFAGGRTNFDHVRGLKQRLPRLTLIAYVEYGPDRAYDLFDAGRLGMDGLILADQHDTPRAFLKLVDQSESRTLGAIVKQSLEGVD